MKNTFNHKIARLIYPGFKFGKHDPKDAFRLAEMGVGGFCVYLGTADQVYKWTRAVRSKAVNPLILSADYEDGTGRMVQGGTLLPSNMAIGASGSAKLAWKKGYITGVESMALGIDWVFAPVVDLATQPGNPIVNTRAFGSDPGLVTKLAGAYMRGLNEAGALQCVKHFPGHGETTKDSHLTLPVLRRTPAQLDKSELVPYKALLKEADSVMLGHLHLNSLDPDYPASFSRKITDGLLRKKLKYRGCVITDALSMKAVEDERSAGVSALLAGADILLVPDDPFKLYDSLVAAYSKGLISDSLIANALKQQDGFLKKLGGGYFKRPSRKVIASAEHLKFSRDAAADCSAWAKEPASPVFGKGQAVAYLEPGCPAPAKWKGKFLVESLKKAGVKVLPAARAQEAALLVGSYSSPRAYAGSINFNDSQKAEIAAALKKRRSMAMVSFGSPFVFCGYLNKLDAGLCAFCDMPEFQSKAAEILTGNAEAKGKMPVKI